MYVASPNRALKYIRVVMTFVVFGSLDLLCTVAMWSDEMESVAIYNSTKE